MAEAGLSIDYNALKIEVGMRHGWGRTIVGMSANNNTDFDVISKRALREFYYPALGEDMPYYEWSFLRKNVDITLVTNTGDYDLPDDFSGTILDKSTSINVAGKPALNKVTSDTIRRLRVNEAGATGYPVQYAVRPKTHAPTTGQRWEMMVHPLPTLTENAAVITGRYVFIPDAISASNKYPVGGGMYGEIVLAAHLAAAEVVIDQDPNGPYKQRFVEMLTVAVRADKEQKLNQGGGVA